MLYNVDMNLKERAKQIKLFLPAVYLAGRSTRTPKKTKILAMITIGYALSPIDLIPDFIPVLGYLDDLVILPALIAWTVHSMPKDLFQEFLREAKEQQEHLPAKKWIYALPVVIIYLLLLWLIVSLIIHR